MSAVLGPALSFTCRRGLHALVQLHFAHTGQACPKPAFLQAGGQRVPNFHRYYAQLVSFPLAQTGEGISECELVAWAVKPGDVVKPFDKLCDVQSDKAAIEITSRYGGKITSLNYAVGAMVKVGAPLLDLEVADNVQVAPEHLSAAHPKKAVAQSTPPVTSSTPGCARTAPASAVAAQQEEPVAINVMAAEVTAQAASAAAPETLPSSTKVCVMTAAATPPPHSAALEPPPSSASGSRAPLPARGILHASPAVRALARETGVDLSLVTGTGPDGRITRADVLHHQAGGGEEEEGGTLLQAGDFLQSAHAPRYTAQEAVVVSSLAAGAGGGALQSTRGRATEERMEYKRLVAQPWAHGDGGGGAVDLTSKMVPLRGYRRAMVASMTAAAAVPVFHFHDEVSCDRLLMARQEMRNTAAQNTGNINISLSVLPIMIKALSVALSHHPLMNASLGSGGAELLLHPHHNIGVAMATPTGLVVPNIKQVERKSVWQVESELLRLKKMANEGRFPEDVLKGGTITVSNIGSIGGTYATPLVSPPEVAIVAMGKMRILSRYPPETSWKLSPSHAPGDSARWERNMQSVPAKSTPLPMPVMVMPISWGADHRVIDGASLAAFSNTWKDLLEAPEKMLLHLA